MAETHRLPWVNVHTPLHAQNQTLPGVHRKLYQVKADYLEFSISHL